MILNFLSCFLNARYHKSQYHSFFLRVPHSSSLYLYILYIYLIINKLQILEREIPNVGGTLFKTVICDSVIWDCRGSLFLYKALQRHTYFVVNSEGVAYEAEAYARLQLTAKKSYSYTYYYFRNTNFSTPFPWSFHFNVVSLRSA